MAGDTVAGDTVAGSESLDLRRGAQAADRFVPYPAPKAGRSAKNSATKSPLPITSQ